MQFFSREKVVFIFAVTSLVLLFLISLLTSSTVTNVSAISGEGVGVYWDSNCLDEVYSIDWLTLAPGSVESYPVYIQNEIDEPIYLNLSTKNWEPSEASDYITLRWDYSWQRIDPDETFQTKLILSVSQDIETISNFSFDILICGSDRLLGDVDGDGKVSVNDMVLVLINFGKSSAEFPEGDIDENGEVSVGDLILINLNFGIGGS